MDVTEIKVNESIPMLVQMGLIGRSQRRSRRPTDDELKQIENEFRIRETHPACKIPYSDIMNFSILSCMRILEVCSIRWDDLDQNNLAVMVRNRKDPRKKIGNHMKVALLGGASDIVIRQPKISDRIFPYECKSITAGFQRVRTKLNIDNLRYHDLRREGASHLFEKGLKLSKLHK
jgi:integrase